MDAANLHGSVSSAAASPISPIEVAHVQWHRPSSEELSVSLTLRWTFPPSKAKSFRVHYRSGSCVSDPEPPLLLIGDAHAPLYRVTDLRVPNAQSEASCRLEFLVEPVPHNGVQVAAALWEKLFFVYSNPKLPSTGGNTNARWINVTPFYYYFGVWQVRSQSTDIQCTSTIIPVRRLQKCNSLALTSDTQRYLLTVSVFPCYSYPIYIRENKHRSQGAKFHTFRPQTAKSDVALCGSAMWVLLENACPSLTCIACYHCKGNSAGAGNYASQDTKIAQNRFLKRHNMLLNFKMY